MGTRYARLFYTLLMNFFVLLLSTKEGRSVPVKPHMITDVMKNDTNLCNTTKFLYESNYIKPCASLPYPTSPSDWDSELEDVNILLCLGMYDMAYKICHYSSQLQINSAEAFDLGVKKFIPSKNQTDQFCHSLQGFTLTYNKTKLFAKPLIYAFESLVRCGIICFNLKDEVKPLCAMLAWSKHITNTVHVDIKEPKLDRLTTKLQSQANSETTGNKSTELKVLSETTEAKEHSTTKQISNNNNANKDKSKSVGNTQNTDVKPDVQRPNPYTEASSGKDKIQKKTNTLPETQAPKVPLLASDKDVDGNSKPIAESAKPLNNLQTSSVNTANEDLKKYVDEDKIDELNKNKDQDADDVRLTTLSENTQEIHDDIPEDPDPAVDSIDDVEEANQQSVDTEGNQNENAQEPYEQKHSTQRFPGLRSDDSHFFFYFTVVTLACIAGYIGYHNKQKILAIVLEGRRSRNSRGRRRPSTANYRKLDCTLEEAVTSQCNSNVTHVIY